MFWRKIFFLCLSSSLAFPAASPDNLMKYSWGPAVIRPDLSVCAILVGSRTKDSEDIVVSFDPNGSQDLNFGYEGQSYFHVPGYELVQLRDLAIDSLGRIYVAGNAFQMRSRPSQLARESESLVVTGWEKFFDTRTINKFFVVRLNSNGQIDKSFGTQGIQVIDITYRGTDDILSIDIDPEDRPVLLLRRADLRLSSLYDNPSHLIRLTPDGDFDETFGESGTVRINTQLGDFSLNGANFRWDGSFYLGGSFIDGKKTRAFGLFVSANGKTMFFVNHGHPVVGSQEVVNYASIAVDVMHNRLVVATEGSNDNTIVQSFILPSGMTDVQFRKEIIPLRFGGSGALGPAFGLKLLPDGHYAVFGRSTDINDHRVIMTGLDRGGKQSFCKVLTSALLDLSY